MMTPSRGGLTPQQINVLTFITQGYTNKQIAERLHVTRGTVECHVHSILRKLGVRNRTEAAYWAMQQLLFALVQHRH